MKILITSGGTKVPIDRVRSITNMSRGTFGSRIADAFFNDGLKAFRTGNEYGIPIEKITFFMAKGSRKPTFQSLNDETYEDGYRPIEYVEYSTFEDYKSGIEDLLKKETYDIIVVAAAVSDYGVANYYNGKYRSREDDMCKESHKAAIQELWQDNSYQQCMKEEKFDVSSTASRSLNYLESRRMPIQTSSKFEKLGVNK